MMGEGNGSSGRLVEEAIDFALSEAVQGTEVERRRISTWPLAYEKKFEQSTLSFKRQGKTNVKHIAVINAIKAARSSHSFQQGMDVETRLLAELSKPEVRGTQYFYFNARRYLNFYRKRPTNLVSKKAVPFLQTAKPPSIYPSELQKIIPKKFVNPCIVGGSDEAIMIAQMFMRSGINCFLLVVRLRCFLFLCILLPIYFSTFSFFLLCVYYSR